MENRQLPNKKPVALGTATARSTIQFHQGMACHSRLISLAWDPARKIVHTHTVSSLRTTSSQCKRIESLTTLPGGLLKLGAVSCSEMIRVNTEHLLQRFMYRTDRLFWYIGIVDEKQAFTQPCVICSPCHYAQKTCYGLTAATPSESVVCKVKSWLSQLKRCPDTKPRFFRRLRRRALPAINMCIRGMRSLPVELPARSPAQCPVEIAGAMALMFSKQHFADSAFLYTYNHFEH